VAHRHQPGTTPPTRPGPDGEARGSTSPGRQNSPRPGHLLLAAVPVAVLGALLALAGSAAPAAAAGASLSACTGTLGGLLVSGGSGQAARAGTAFADPLAAEVVDTGGCPLSNVDVEFVAPTSGAGATFPGSATTATVATGTDGVVTAPSLTANEVSGSYTVVAEVASTGYEVSFQLENTTSGVASSVGVSSGNDQSAQVGQQFALPLAVNVLDSYGAPVADASVSFTIIPSNGAGSSFLGAGNAATAQTNESGMATSPLLVAGSTSGPFTVQASVSGLSKLVTFTLTDRASAPYAIAAGAGTAQQAQVGMDFAVPLAVTVTDSSGNAVAGAKVTFSAPGGGASGVFAAHGATAVVITSSKGVAVAPGFSADEAAGGYIVTARVAGLASVATFALVNTARTDDAAAAPAGSYWLAATDGHVLPSGAASLYRPLPGESPPSHVVGMAATPDGRGYWLVTSSGQVCAYGDARLFGAAAVPHLSNAAFIGIASTPDGRGYWLARSSGAVYAFGDARYYGSKATARLATPIVGIAGAPGGKGYWLVAKNGGVFAFGRATFFGSTTSSHLSAPIVSMAAMPAGKGYWLVAKDGGVFAFGGASFYGSANGVSSQPAVAVVPTPDAGGYWVVRSNGTVTGFGDAGSQGSPASKSPVVAGAAAG
jgi:hypothetical protein